MSETNDQLTAWSVMNGDAYRDLTARYTALKIQGADILAQRMGTQNPDKIGLLEQALSANEQAKSDLSEASAHYNIIAEQARKYFGYLGYNPPSIALGNTDTSAPGGFFAWLGLGRMRGMGAFGSLGFIPAAVVEAAVFATFMAAAAAAIYSMTYLLTHSDQLLNSAANFLSQAKQIPEAIAQGAQGGVVAASGAVDVLGKLGLYAGLGFGAYLIYQQLKKRGKI